MLTRLPVVCVLQMAAVAAAQPCTPQWLPSPGANGRIRDLLVSEGMVIAGGYFTQAGSAECARVAAWDGVQWSPLGQGLGTFGFVNALAEYTGEVIAGGRFDFAGSTDLNIARWDGQQWSPLGPTGLPGRIDELAVYNGVLYATGEGGMNKWNGAVWQHMPLCCTFVSVPSMTLHDNRLVGAWMSNDGNFPELSRVRAWNGVSWATLGTTIFGTADDMRVGVAGGILYVGAMDTPQRTVWSWNGSGWDALAPPPGGVRMGSIGEYKQKLVIGNEHGPYVWDGAAWQTLGGGVNGAVNATVEFNGQLIVGGIFESAGGQAASNFARWGCPAPSCYPDCNDDGSLTLADFSCFQTKFALGDLYADCNGDLILNLADFGCFQTAFALGCP